MVKRTALARMWTDTLDVIVQEGRVNPENGRTEFAERALYRNIPCRLSYRTPAQAVRVARAHGDYVTETEQMVQLFLGVDVSIPAGSKLVVRRGESELLFARSGVPAVFTHHQEVRVERFVRFA